MRDLLERKILFFAQDKGWRRIDLVTQDPPSPPVIVFSPPPPIYLHGIKEELGVYLTCRPPPTRSYNQRAEAACPKKHPPPSLSVCAHPGSDFTLLPPSPNCLRWWSRFFGQKRPSPRCIQGISPSTPALRQCRRPPPPHPWEKPSPPPPPAALVIRYHRRQPGNEQKTHFTSFLFPSPHAHTEG